MVKVSCGEEAPILQKNRSSYSSAIAALGAFVSYVVAPDFDDSEYELKHMPDDPRPTN